MCSFYLIRRVPYLADIAFNAPHEERVRLVECVHKFRKTSPELRSYR